MELNFVDLFSCGGGMSTGFTKQGNFRTIGAVDLEVAKPSYGVGATNCNDTYEANLGLRPLSANLAHTPPEEISSHFGFAASDVDVLISCAPCTGFSQKKANNHIEDDARNQLVERTALYAEAWRPQYVVIENVKELLNGRHKHHFQGLHRNLTRLGYEVFAEIHNLRDFGLTDIPLEAYDYVVNGKPAIEWVMERQGVSVDRYNPETKKGSDIVNDANCYANETMGDPRYPYDLLRRVITVSLETVKIVKSLPKLDI